MSGKDVDSVSESCISKAVARSCKEDDHGYAFSLGLLEAGEASKDDFVNSL
jgi:hypothetical protein